MTPRLVETAEVFLIAAILIAALYVIQVIGSRRFDRRYPHLTRTALRDAEAAKGRDGDGI